jgi:hypothetical protein
LHSAAEFGIIEHCTQKENDVDSELVRLLKDAKAKQEERLTADRQAKILKAEEDELKALVMQQMVHSGLTNLSLDGTSARIERKEKPYIADFTALEGYIVEHRATDLLQKRLTESAVKLRWEDGIVIPGVGTMTEEKLIIK